MWKVTVEILDTKYNCYDGEDEEYKNTEFCQVDDDYFRTILFAQAMTVIPFTDHLSSAINPDLSRDHPKPQQISVNPEWTSSVGNQSYWFFFLQ